MYIVGMSVSKLICTAN